MMMQGNFEEHAKKFVESQHGKLKNRRYEETHPFFKMLGSDLSCMSGLLFFVWHVYIEHAETMNLRDCSNQINVDVECIGGTRT